MPDPTGLGIFFELFLMGVLQVINNGPAMNPSTEDVIRNAAADAGVYTVYATHVDQTEDYHIFDIYDEHKNYMFSIETEMDTIFER